MITLAASDSEIIRTVQEPGFSQWFVYLLVFLLIGAKAVTGGVWLFEKLRASFVKEPKEAWEVNGRIEMRPEKLFAEKTVTENALATLALKLEEVSGEMQRLNAADREAASQRLETLKTSIHKEMQRLSEKGGEHIEACFKDAYQRINQQGERIAALEATDKANAAAALSWRT